MQIYIEISGIADCSVSQNCLLTKLNLQYMCLFLIDLQ